MDKNSALVTDRFIQTDVHKYSRYIRGKTALVAQGGGQRGIFTSGVIDAFISEQFDPFQQFYGTSAGALNLCAYLCRQPNIGKSFILELTTQPEFFNLFGYIRHRQTMGIDWAIERILQAPYNLDLDLARKVVGERDAYASVTALDTLKDEYLPILGASWRDTMRATCAIPKLYNCNVEVNGRRYIDGGVSASIPVQEAWRRNARSIIVIRTEPIDQIESYHDASLYTEEELQWFTDAFDGVQEKWQQKITQWKQDWSSFFKSRIGSSLHTEEAQNSLLNGGRWLFGADNVYRLSHLIGDPFDSELADMLMVHYQTYSLTQAFLANPPDDTFIVQIAPLEQLKSSSLLSREEDLLHDYQLGFDAGRHFVRLHRYCMNLSDVQKQ